MNPLNNLAIIMDGNGRWGVKYKRSRNLGHKAGLKTVEKIIKFSIKNRIKFLTLFAFSSENWKRPKKEIEYLFHLLENFLNNKIDNLNKQGVRLKIIGKIAFNPKLNLLLKQSEAKTNLNKQIQINLAINYGSKEELIRTIKNLIKNKITINKKNISSNLYTKNIPDPDILIRTGNTNRLSNFMLWQISYTEIFFVKKLWPDFNEVDYIKIIEKFKKLKRNFGSIK